MTALNRHTRGLAGAVGFIALYAVVLTGVFIHTRDHALWLRVVVCLCLVAANALAVGVFLFLRHALGRAEDTAEIVRDAGVLVGGLVAIIAVYAAAHALLGFAYTADVVRQRDLTVIPLRHDYVTAFYFSAVTLSTLGYGDFQPGEAGRAVAAFQSLNGFLLLSLSVSYFFKLLEVRVETDSDE